MSSPSYTLVDVGLSISKYLWKPVPRILLVKTTLTMVHLWFTRLSPLVSTISHPTKHSCCVSSLFCVRAASLGNLCNLHYLHLRLNYSYGIINLPNNPNFSFQSLVISSLPKVVVISICKWSSNGN